MPVVPVNSLTVFFILWFYNLGVRETLEFVRRHNFSPSEPRHSRHYTKTKQHRWKDTLSLSSNTQSLFSARRNTSWLSWSRHEAAAVSHSFPPFRAAICSNCRDELYIFNTAQSLDEERRQGGFYVDHRGFLLYLKEDCGSVGPSLYSTPVEQPVKTKVRRKGTYASTEESACVLNIKLFLCNSFGIIRQKNKQTYECQTGCTQTGQKSRLKMNNLSH